MSCILATSILLTSYLVHPAAVTSASQCEEVKSAYLNMGYSALDVPTSSVVLAGQC